jgi:hypothetical protein
VCYSDDSLWARKIAAVACTSVSAIADAAAAAAAADALALILPTVAYSHAADYYLLVTTAAHVHYNNSSAAHSAEEYDSLDGDAPTAAGGPRISAETAAFLKQLEAAERRVARMKLVDRSAAVTSHDTSAGT